MTVEIEVSLPTLRPHTELVRGILPILVCSVLWGAVGLVSVCAPAAASPESVGALGLLVAGVLMLATRPGARALLRRCLAANPAAEQPQPYPQPLPLPQPQANSHAQPYPHRRGRERTLVLTGSFGLLFYPLAFFPAVRLLGVALATAITLGSAPLFTGLIARFVERRRPTRRWLRCAPVAVLGTVLLVAGDGGARQVSALGVVLALIPGLSYSTVSTVAARMIGEGRGSKDVYGAMFGTCAVWCVPVLAVYGVAWAGSVRGALVVLFFGCVTNLLCYTLFGNALRHTTAATATTVTLAEGAVGTLLGVFVHGERLAPAAWGGLALLTIALVLLSVPGRAPRARE